MGHVILPVSLRFSVLTAFDKVMTQRFRFSVSIQRSRDKDSRNRDDETSSKNRPVTPKNVFTRISSLFILHAGPTAVRPINLDTNERVQLW